MAGDSSTTETKKPLNRAAMLVTAPGIHTVPAAEQGPSYDHSAIARRGYFYVGGSYVGEPGKRVMHGQMYVEVLTPREPRHRYPLVLIQGAAQTATNWLGTPDGRPGWADFFVGQVIPSIWSTSRRAAARHGSRRSTAS
jgi:hypothetical protein